MDGIEIPTLITFMVYLIGMAICGIIFYRLTSNMSDYVLGGRSLNGWVAALSAGASDMSSWILIALPGTIYLNGLSEIWLPIGLTIGAYLNWQFLAKRLRRYTHIAGDAITLPDFLENRFRDHTRILRIVSAFFILLFFTFYTSSGLVGGAVLFSGTFNWDYEVALIIGTIAIVSYTFLGGFAISYTDFFQGTLMLLALVIVPIVAVYEIGSWDAAVTSVAEINPEYLDAFAGTSVIAIISLLGWGLGYFGQPHIITRFMAIRSERDVPTGRLVGMTWMVISLFGAIFVGVLGIAYFDGIGPGTPLDNHETVFIIFSQVLFNPWVAGFLLAAILSAIMSTVDSQLLVSSSALAEDFYKGSFAQKRLKKNLFWIGRFGVVLIALVAMVLGFDSDNTVLELVEYAWGGFGAAFGPVMLFCLFWKRMTVWGAVAGITTGGLTVIIWSQFQGGLFDLYELVPGFLLGSLAIVIVSLLGKKPSQEIIDEFAFVEEAEYDETKRVYYRR
ncbi:LOW QUALITY PROTEIN: proline/sodium symporter PutP [Geomicrobium sp. JCM 19039]|nr:LOW QUALITY PROTEIN: proline/sodium symporter PutP [Geomicrobium sp. JCM 19039]